MNRFGFRTLIALCALFGLFTVGAGSTQAGVSYVFDVTTQYMAGLPTPGDYNFSDFGTAAPDTAYWRFTNSGTTTFSGTIGQTAVSNVGGWPGFDFSYSHFILTLLPGQTAVFAVNDEASNMGGYNGISGSVQPGVIIAFSGTVTDGVNTDAVSGSVADADIHSGFPRTNGFGETLDSYVLQGGTSTGGDTGDAYEETQADGHFRFASAVPEPSSVLLAGIGMIGLGIYRRRRANKLGA